MTVSLLPVVHLHPGALVCERRPILIHTLLGSCVAVALWDRRLRYGGMLHALLPQAPAGGRPSPRYVDTGISLLLDAMRGHGSALRDIEAKLFGGADLLPQPGGGRSIGERNIAAAMARLEAHDIGVGAVRVGGGAGFVVRLSTGTGTALVRRMAPSETVGE